MAAVFRSPAAQFDAVTAQVVGLTQPQIVAEAKRLHAGIMIAPPRPVSFKRHVDGVEAKEEAVKIGGVIVYDYNRLDLIADLAMEILRELSPVKEGVYVAGHRIVMKRPEEIRISNTVEYSRVIELGARGSTKLRIQKGGHVYERAARKLRSFPDVASSVKATFSFTEVDVPRGANSSRNHQWPTLILTAL